MDTSFLTRPVVFFDLEATGANPVTDRITEIACTKISPDGSKVTKKTYVNPEMPISKEAMEVTGITQETVANAPTFRSIAQNILSFIDNCDLAGYNIGRFDVPMLITEFKRSGVDYEDVMIAQNTNLWDPFQVVCKKYPRDLSSIYKLETGKDLVDAHSAEADIDATIELAFLQLNKWPDIGKNMEEITQFCRNDRHADRFGKLIWKDGEVAIGFGKNNGRTLRDLSENDRGYLTWCITKADFPKDTVQIIENATMGRYLTKDKGYVQ